MRTLADIRKELGMKQADFAEKYHIPLGTLKRWENGYNRTPEYVMYMMERILALEKAGAIVEQLNTVAETLKGTTS